MGRDIFFSIIIPTLNEESYLPKILSDLASQRVKNFEVIVVDALSQDKTREKALEFSKYFTFYFYSVEKKNVSFQRNFGGQKAKSEYIIFLDADSRVNKMFTGNLYKEILKKRGSLFLPTLITEERSSKNILLFKLVNSVIELSQSSNKPLAPGGSIIITKKLFTQLNGFKEDLYITEDHNLVQRARKMGIKAKFLRDIKVVFSLRRVKKEGQVRVMYKYILALIFIMVDLRITSNIFMYEMGGDVYKDLESKDKWGIKKNTTKFRSIVKKTSSFLVDSLS
ncbi:MAG: glycosyltransferase [Candidatus Levybacteria bacterium]|nr:glycosyltransferase [Candidatus Levybacteria bacterium]